MEVCHSLGAIVFCEGAERVAIGEDGGKMWNRGRNGLEGGEVEEIEAGGKDLKSTCISIATG